ncbi:MAG TPA: hypothetical protein VGF14_01015 [Alphaproteobacteria bacterium]
MSFILRSHHDRYRQRNRESLIRTTTTICLVAIALSCGYLFGKQRSAVAHGQAELAMQDMQKRIRDNENTMINLRSRNETLNIELSQLKGQYKTQVPTGDLQTLVQLLQEQTDKGMSVERLSQLIKAARPPQNCSTPQSKRFILSTPAYEGPESKITFAEGAVAVSGNGEASINSKGSKEAWFDAGKKVKITFTQPGGIQEIKEGILPLHHTIIRNDKEYRFSISEGPRSFVVVTSDNCDYQEADRGHYQPSVRTTTTVINSQPQPASPAPVTETIAPTPAPAAAEPAATR